ncbi:hypothetical protein [Candidatus Halobonum tyrrellensis]|uniref:Uncharacterized protein n=1 Tax=Candidatus Halobonum tyrrellensis G22 TaxID=1324957 RepID=V4IUY0_9EURY|nr:hypothetical protein [Candidatus Halobonum tyrrellensis]ESP87012.1 hypothetical protein K933_15872 [Candidatus Halobonum tyrrellensis G22]
MAVTNESQQDESPRGGSRAESGGGPSLLPKSRLFWGAVGFGLLLILLGMFLITGPMAAIVGVWGISLIGAAVVGFALFQVWYRMGT